MSTVWVLTREINEYDQDGAYFERVWLNKPTMDQLMAHLNSGDRELMAHILAGGGRQKTEHTWYILKEEQI